MIFLRADSGAYNAKFQAWLDRLTALGYTLPSAAQRSKLNILFAGLEADGTFALLDAAWLFMNDSGSENAGKVNIINPALYECTKFGTINYASNDGITGDGLTGGYSSNYNPSVNGVNFTRDNNSFGVYVMDAGIQASKIAIGAGLIETTGQGYLLNPRNTGDNYRSQNNNAVTSSTANALTAVGLTSNVRTSPANYKIAKSGVDAGTVVQASSPIVNLAMAISAFQGSSNRYSFYANTIAFAYAGSGNIDQLKLNNRLTAFISNP